MRVEDRETARLLRKSGRSIKEIAAIIGASKSSISAWVKDIVLTDWQKQNLLLRQKKNQAKLAEFKISNARRDREFAELTGYSRAAKDEEFRLVCMLYWGEGTKKGNTFGFANCDQDMLRLIFYWLLKEGYCDNIRFSIIYYIDNGLSEKDIKRWWMSGIPALRPSHFCACRPKKTDDIKHKKVGKTPYGTAYLKVHRVKLLHQILGGIKYLKEEYSDMAQLARASES